MVFLTEVGDTEESCEAARLKSEALGTEAGDDGSQVYDLFAVRPPLCERQPCGSVCACLMLSRCYRLSSTEALRKRGTTLPTSETALAKAPGTRMRCR